MQTTTERSDRAVQAASAAGSTLSVVALVLLIIGGLNWALVGLFSFDLVAALFGPLSPISRIVYILVGLAAVYCAFCIPRWSRLS